MRPKQFSDLTGSGSTLIQATADRLTGLVPREPTACGHRRASTPPSSRSNCPTCRPPRSSWSRQDATPRPPSVSPPCASQRIDARCGPSPLALRSRHRGPSSVPDGAALRSRSRTRGPHRHARHPADLPAYGLRIHRARRRSFPRDRGRARCRPTPCVRFLEKPSLEVAEGFVAGGAHYWNAGIFVARVDQAARRVRTTASRALCHPAGHRRPGSRRPAAGPTARHLQRPGTAYPQLASIMA